MNFATTKERIIQYIEYKSITASNFFIQTGLKRGFLDSDKLKASVSDVFIAKIIATYEDLNVYWLITGKGKMLLDKQEEKQDVEQINKVVLAEPILYAESELVKNLKETVAYLRKDIEELKDDKEVLKNIIKTKLGKANAS